MFSTVGEMGVLRSGQEPPPVLGCHHRPLVRLYCLNGGHHLRILPDGTVGGGRLEHDLYGEEERVGRPHLVWKLCSSCADDLMITL